MTLSKAAATSISARLGDRFTSEDGGLGGLGYLHPGGGTGPSLCRLCPLPRTRVCCCKPQDGGPPVPHPAWPCRPQRPWVAGLRQESPRRRLCSGQDALGESDHTQPPGMDSRTSRAPSKADGGAELGLLGSLCPSALQRSRFNQSRYEVSEARLRCRRSLPRAALQ